MRKSIIILMATALCPLYAQKVANATDNTAVNFFGKPVESKEVTLKDFSSIYASTSLKVVVIKSKTRKALIKSNAMQFVQASVESGKLYLHYNNHNMSLNNPVTEVIVYTPDFNRLDADLASTITVEGGFSLEDLIMELKSSATITGDFAAKNITIHASSSAHFSGKVKAGNLNLDCSSSAYIEAEGHAKKVNADASSTAKISLAKLKFTTIQKEESSRGRILVK